MREKKVESERVETKVMVMGREEVSPQEEVAMNGEMMEVVRSSKYS